MQGSSVKSESAMLDLRKLSRSEGACGSIEVGAYWLERGTCGRDARDVKSSADEHLQNEEFDFGKFSLNAYRDERGTLLS